MMTLLNLYKIELLVELLLMNIYHPKTDELIAEEGLLITEKMANAIEEAGIDEVEIRSVLTCEMRRKEFVLSVTD